MKNRKKAFSLIILLSGIILTLTNCKKDDPSGGNPNPYNLQTLDSAGDVGSYTSIAIDYNSKVHISCQ